MELKDLTIENLSSGYVFLEESNEYVCIFCGERFEEGIVYLSHGKYITAERAVKEHILKEHNGVFYGLLNLDKEINGLSSTQKKILSSMYQEKDNRTIGEELNINTATVRTHKFNIQKMKKEAKILLAILEQIENEEVVSNRKQLEASLEQEKNISEEFNANDLHPFFTKFEFK